MASHPAASPSTAVRLHWRSGRVRSVTLPPPGPAVEAAAVGPAGPPLQPLPATQGVVGRTVPAVNDATLSALLALPAPAGPPAAAKRWEGWLRAAANWSAKAWGVLRRPRSAAMPVARVGRGWLGGHALSRWPASWPYADAGLGGGSNSFPSSGGDHLHFAPDVVVDQNGRILRL